MCAIRNPYNCHACLLCGMRCDSLLVVLRHLDGLHPSVGYEYDPETQRMYLWFAPEHDFLRPNLPGLVDHWELLKFHKRMNGKSVPYPRDVFSSGNGSPSSSPLPPEVTHYADNRPVFQWISAKYIPPHLRLPGEWSRCISSNFSIVNGYIEGPYMWTQEKLLKFGNRLRFFAMSESLISHRKISAIFWRFPWPKIWSPFSSSEEKTLDFFCFRKVLFFSLLQRIS